MSIKRFETHEEDDGTRYEYAIMDDGTPVPVSVTLTAKRYVEVESDLRRGREAMDYANTLREELRNACQLLDYTERNYDRLMALVGES